MRENIAFKWWTACYFFHGLDRFSTDLDFDVIFDNGELEAGILNMLKKYGEIKKWRNIVLSYSTNDDNIKIDLNRKVWTHNEYEILNFFWIDIKVQKKSTIFANKLVALLERNTNRDIYDVWFFLKNNWDIHEPILLERTGKTKKQLYWEVIAKLKSLPKNYKILDWLGEVLNPKQKAFVKERLISELISKIEFELCFNR
jgi:predicted nucleotidyltransferase component of viral defense system